AEDMKEFPQDVVTAPYGTWSSPLDASEVAAGAAPIFDAAFRGDDIFFSTKLPAEKARTGLVRTCLARPGHREQILPTGFNIRSAVHEYGGASWALDPGSEVIYFVNAADQRVWQIIPGRAPHPLTPDTSGLVRYGDLHMSPWGLLCVREDCRSTRRERAIVLLTKHGTTNVLSTHSHFMAWPRLSPDGSTLAFIGWDHPNMPWDGTNLWLIDVRTPATPAAAVLIGDAVDRPLHDPPATASPTDGGVSLLQPEVTSDSSLHVISDHRGHRALYSPDLPPGARRPLPTDAPHPPAPPAPSDGGASLLQPAFPSDSSLHVISDHRGHWALYSLDFTPGAGRPLTTDAHHAPATTQLGLEMLRGVLDTGRDTVAYAGRETASYAARDTGGAIGGARWQLGAKWHLHDGDEVWAHAQSSTATRVRCRSGEGTWDALTPMGETFGTMDLLDLGRTHLLMTAKSTKRPGVLYAVERATGLFTEIAR